MPMAMPPARYTATGTTVHIDRLVHGGWGLSRLPSGKVALVAGALPGETVRIRILREAGGHVEAKIETLLQPAPERIHPPCPHYAHCGGCNLQHAEYAAQLGMKTGIVADSLRRGGLHEAAELLTPALPSPQPLGYRHRLRLHLQKTGHPGFHRRRSNSVVPVRHCLLATEGINAALARLVQETDTELLGRCGHALTLAQCPASGRLALVLHTDAPLPRSLAQALAAMLGTLADVVCTEQGQHLHILHPHPGQDTEGHDQALHQHFDLGDLAYTLSWSPACFFQVNCRQNAQLVALAVEAAGPAHMVLDLCCGAGNFAIPLALRGAVVLGVESSAEAVRWARFNGERAGVREIRFTRAEAAQELTRLLRRGTCFDTVVLDPPRQGLGQAARLVPELFPDRIVSISCDPATHARDLRPMLAAGYRPVGIRPLDMFPQTHHIETLALLERC